MNYRRLFVIAVVLNLATGVCRLLVLAVFAGHKTIRKRSHRASADGRVHSLCN